MPKFKGMFYHAMGGSLVDADDDDDDDDDDEEEEEEEEDSLPNWPILIVSRTSWVAF